jgi:hypothetical protein
VDAEGLNIDTASAGCCLSAADAGGGMSSARQAFFGDFLWRQKVTGYKLQKYFRYGVR